MKNAKPGPATWTCSRCGHVAERPLTATPVFQQLAKAVCSACGARGQAVILQGDREYGLTSSFAALEARRLTR